MTIRVLVVDDQELMRSALSMMVESQDDFELAGTAVDGQDAVDRLAADPVDVVMMDVRMPRLDGIAATRRIVADHPGTKVLVLTTFDLDQHALAALRAGASGFLLKDSPAEDIVAAVRTVAAGVSVIAPTTTRRLVAHLTRPRPDPGELLAVLTDREREVFAELAGGASNAEIGRRLHLSETTVKTHVGRVLHKLRLRDRVQAVVLAYESGVVRPGG